MPDYLLRIMAARRLKQHPRIEKLRIDLQQIFKK